MAIKHTDTCTQCCRIGPGEFSSINPFVCDKCRRVPAAPEEKLIWNPILSLPIGLLALPFVLVFAVLAALWKIVSSMGSWAAGPIRPLCELGDIVLTAIKNLIFS